MKVDITKSKTVQNYLSTIRSVKQSYNQGYDNMKYKNSKNHSSETSKKVARTISN